MKDVVVDSEAIRSKLKKAGKVTAVAAVSVIAAGASLASTGNLPDFGADQPQDVNNADAVSNADNSAQTVQTQIDENKDKLQSLSANDSKNLDYSRLGC